MTDPPFISAAQIDAALDWPGLLAALERGHAMPRPEFASGYLHRARGSLVNPAAWIDGLGMAVKTVSVFPDNPVRSPPLDSVQGLVVLFEDRTGRVVAVIEAAAETRWKTVADSLLGARCLARPDSRTLLVVGAGVIGSTAAAAYPVIFPGLRQVLIWNRSPARAEELAVRLSRDPAFAATGRNVTALPPAELDAGVVRADIICCATMATEPLIRGECLPAGAHLDLIGSFQPHMREADDEAMRRGRIFVNYLNEKVLTMGDLRAPIAAGIITPDAILGSLYELIAGEVGRNDAAEITIYKNSGGGHLDLMAARHIHAQVIGGTDAPGAGDPPRASGTG